MLLFSAFCTFLHWPLWKFCKHACCSDIFSPPTPLKVLHACLLFWHNRTIHRLTKPMTRVSKLSRHLLFVSLWIVLLNLNIFWLTKMVLSIDNLRCPERLFLQNFLFTLLIRLFLLSKDLKRVDRSLTAELADF